MSRSPGTNRPPAVSLPGYAELVCRSNFSFLGGASHPEELIARAQALRYAALAVTDECSLAGVVRAHLEATQTGLPLLIGSDFTLHPEAAAAAETSTLGAPPHALPGASPWAPPSGLAPDAAAADIPSPPGHSGGLRLVMLAMSRRGYANLSHWISVCRRRAPKGQYRARMSDLEGRVPAAPMLAGLPGCLALLVVSCVLPVPSSAAPAAADQVADPFQTLFAHALWLKTWFGDRAALALPLLLQPHDALLSDITQRVAALTGLPIVAVGDVRMHARSRKPLLDVLQATRQRCTVATAGLGLAANAEAHLRSRARLARLYKPEWLHNTLVLAGRCAFSLGELKYEYPREIVPEGHTPASWLRALTEEGAAQRYPKGVPPAVRAMLEHELALIQQLQLRGLFPHRGRHRAMGARPGHPVPGPRQRGQFGGLLLPGRDGGRPRGAHHAALRALHQRRTR